MSYVLLTRAIEDSRDLAARIKTETPFIPILSPVLTIKTQSALTLPEEHKKFVGLIFTSHHAVKAFQPFRENFEENIPVYAIGERTAQELNNHDFSVTRHFYGSSENLCAFLSNRSANRDVFLHIGGRHISKIFQANINKYSINITHWSVYEAVAAHNFSDETEQKFREGYFKVALFYSPRSAEIFEHICEENNLKESLKQTQALCLSPAVVKSLHKDYWLEIIAANEPTTDAMLNALKNLEKTERYNE